MTAQAVQNPFPTFTDSDGQPLTGGYVYFGQASQDPRQYPVTVYYDKAMTIVAAQPLRTTAGFIYRNGSPANVWLPSGVAYSVMVLDAAQAQVSYSASWQGVADEAAVAAVAAAQPYVTAAAASASAAAGSAGAAAASASAALANGRIYASQAAAQGDGALAAGSYYAVPQASPATTFYDLYIKVSGVASTYVNTYPSMQAVTDQILKLTASVGDVYALGTVTLYGTTSPNAATDSGNTNTYFPTTPTTQRGYLQDVSVRASAGTGQIVIISPDPASPQAFLVTAVANVTVVTGVNTFLAASIYTGVIPAGSYIGYRILTGGMVYGAGSTRKIFTVAQTVGQHLNGSFLSDTLQPSFAFNIRPALTTSLDERLMLVENGTNARNLQLSAMLGNAVSAPTTTYGSVALAATGDLPTVNWVYAVAPTTAPGVLDTVSIKCSNPSADPAGSVAYAAQVAVGQMDSTGNVVVTDTYTVYVAAGQTNVISGFGEKVLPAGSFVMVAGLPSHGPIQYKTGTADGGGWVGNFAGALSAGSSVPLAGYANTVILSYTLRQPTSALPARLARMALDLDTSNPVALERTQFPGTSLPTGWSASGAWTVNNGLTPPAVGGWGVKALSGTYSSIVNRNISAKITINSTDTITGIAASPQDNLGGVAVLIDGVAGKLRIYTWLDTGAAGTLRSETALPAALTAGRTYTLDLQKVGFNLTATFSDPTTQQTCTATLDGAATYTMAGGKCGALFISATTPPTFQWLEHVAPYYRRLRALILGDSICEGAYLGSASPTWAAQLAAARATQKDIVVAGRAGETTTNFFKRKGFDEDLWLPQFVLIALGTNDTDQTLWRYNTALLMAKAAQLGAEPILCTQVPKTSAQALRTAMNTDIRSGYFGRYRYIDMALAVSNAHDGVTWNATYDFGDGIHPTAAGQNLMYAQALIDAPFLIR